MSQADTSRFYPMGPPHQKYRPHPHPQQQHHHHQQQQQQQHRSRRQHHQQLQQHHHGIEITELNDHSDHEGFEDRKYKTLDMPRHHRSQQQSQDYNTNSLERGMLRRRLPDIPPSRSLPRPGKQPKVSSREQSDSRSRDRQLHDQKQRSQSHGDELQVRKKKSQFTSIGLIFSIFKELVNFEFVLKKRDLPFNFDHFFFNRIMTVVGSCPSSLNSNPGVLLQNTPDPMLTL